MKVGIPGKSSVAGSMMMVLPNTMGKIILTFSLIGKIVLLLGFFCINERKIVKKWYEENYFTETNQWEV